MTSETSIDRQQVGQFDALASDWWDPQGALGPLHKLNPPRLQFLRDEMAATFHRDPQDPQPLAGLTVLDVGCGGGLVSEPLARLGAQVTGIDASPRAIATAIAHGAQEGLGIDYREATTEDLIAEGRTFDAVVALEVVEHVPDPQAFLGGLARLVAPGGLVALSTLNRTAKAYAFAIVAAERVLRWLPPGTHEWRRFRTPDEIATGLAAHGVRELTRCGMVYEPLKDRFRLARDDVSVNYLLAARRAP